MTQNQLSKANPLFKKWIKVFLIIPFVFTILQSEAQETVLSAGGSVTAAEGSLDFSIGQAIYSNPSNDNGSISDGIQVAHENFGIHIQYATNNENITFYPNPSDGILFISTEKNQSDQKIDYKVFSLSGISVLEAENCFSSEGIDISSLTPGLYIVSLQMQNTHTIATIIKK